LPVDAERERPDDLSSRGGEMDGLIGYCGIVCTECEAFKATQAGDMAALERVAESWRKAYDSPEITVESVTCDGCITESERKCGHWSECEIRACAMERSLVNCGHCEDYPCQRLEGFFEYAPDARATLDGVRAALA